MAQEPVLMIGDGNCCSLLVLKLMLKSVFHSKSFWRMLAVFKPISTPLFTISPTFSQRCSKPTDKGCDTCSSRSFVTLRYTSTVRLILLNKPRSIPALNWCLLSQVKFGLGNCSGVAATAPLYWLL